MRKMVEDVQVAMHELGDILGWFAYRPKTLIADMVLYAFINDVIESGWVVDHITRTELPHRSLPNARNAFEAAQQAMVLVSQEDYAFAGARAMAYFFRKECELRAIGNPEVTDDTYREDAEKWYQDQLKVMSDLWDRVSPGQGQLLYQADKAIRADKTSRPRKPDNWLGINMAEAQSQAYQLIYSQAGVGITEERKKMNRILYGSLSRDSHTGYRFENITVKMDETGFIDVEFAKRDRELTFKSARQYAIQAAQELAAAIRYRNKRVDNAPS